MLDNPSSYNILLVNPWVQDFFFMSFQAKPLGILCIGDQLKKAGWNVELLDFVDGFPPTPKDKRSIYNKQYNYLSYMVSSDGPCSYYGRGFTPMDTPELLYSKYTSQYYQIGLPHSLAEQEIKKLNKPDVILITSFMTFWYGGVINTINFLKHYFPDTPIVLGGVYASLMPLHAINNSGADYVVTGLGEHNLPDILSELTGVSRDRVFLNDGVFFNPDLSLVKRVRFIPVLTSRGCTNSCAYCASSSLYTGFIQNEVESVVRYIYDSVLRYGVKDIIFHDDALLVEAPTHFLKIITSPKLVTLNLRWHVPNGLNISLITEEVVLAMRQANFGTIRLALESTSLKYGTKTSLKDFERALSLLTSSGFDPGAIDVFLMGGFPGQSLQSVVDAVDYLKPLGVAAYINSFSPVPGSMYGNLLTSKYPELNDEPLLQHPVVYHVATPEWKLNYPPYRASFYRNQFKRATRYPNKIINLIMSGGV